MSMSLSSLDNGHPHTNLADFLYIAAAKVPHKVCIETDTGCYTYAQMVRMVESIRLVLRRALLKCPECQIPAVTAKPDLWRRRQDEHAICIVLDRGAECVAAVHATMLERCVYNTFDANEPREKLKCWIEIAEHPVMITSKPVMERLELTEKGWTFGGDFPRFVLNVHEILDKTDAKVDSIPPVKHDPADKDRLCYVIFTSGSTGKPKAVMIQHASACNLVRVWSDFVGLRESDRPAQMASMSFDNHVPEVYGAMFKCATSIVVPDVMKRSGPDMLSWLSDKQVNLMVTVPSHLRSMLGPGVDVSTVSLPHLRVLDIGGEALGRDVLDAWAPGRTMFNIYGPTEITVVCCGIRVEPGDEITIGHDLPTYSNRVLRLSEETQQLEDCPQGERGVLYTGGIGCARGYLDDEEKTTSKFVMTRYGRMYCSNDVVSQDTRGRIHYHGRADWQVKVRGIRIELEALEEAVGNVPGVKHCESRVIDEGRKLVVIVSGPNPSEHDIKEAAAKLGKGYMLNQVKIVDQSAWKFNTSGKLVRNHVPLEDRSSGTTEGPPKDSWSTFKSEGTTALQCEIAKCVAQFVKAEKEWTVESHFIEELGLDSAGFGKLITLLRRQPDLKSISLPVLFLNATVVQLADYVEANKAEQSDESDDEDCAEEAQLQQAANAPADLLHIFLARCVGFPLKSRASSPATNLLARIPIPPKMLPAESQRQPHAPCAELSSGETKTYTQVFHLALAMATLLRRAERRNWQHLGEEGVVAIALRPSLEQTTAMLACLLQRRSFVLVDTGLGGDKLQAQLHSVTVGAVLADSREAYCEQIKSDVPEGTALADVADLTEILSQPLKARRPKDNGYRGACCMLFTQGSTGTKAALYSHSSLSWATRSLKQVLGLESSDRAIQLFRTGSMPQLLTPWALFEAGACQLYPPSNVSAGSGLRAWLAVRQATVLGGLPADLRALGSEVAASFRALRHVWVAGQPCPSDLARIWSTNRIFTSLLSRAEVPVAMAFQMQPGATFDYGLNTLLPYGQVLPGCSAYILDHETWNPVPHGQQGILAVSCPGLADGYLNSLENTGHFASMENNGGVFLCGDVVRHGLHGVDVVSGTAPSSWNIARAATGRSFKSFRSQLTIQSTPKHIERGRTSLSSFGNYLIEQALDDLGEQWEPDANLPLNFFGQTLFMALSLILGAVGLVVLERFLFAYAFQVDQIWIGMAVLVVLPQLFKLLVGLLACLLKWILIGRYKEGRYPIYGSFYFRHWVVEQVVSRSILGKSNLSSGWNFTLGDNCLRVLLLKLMGAKVSMSAVITTQVTGWDLIEVGDLSTICGPHHLTSVTYVKKHMLIRRQRIGRGVTVAHGAVVGPGAVLKDGTFVECLSSIPAGTVCDGGRWSGVPATCISNEKVDRTDGGKSAVSKEDYSDVESDSSGVNTGSESSDSDHASSSSNDGLGKREIGRGCCRAHSKIICAQLVYSFATLLMAAPTIAAAILGVYVSREILDWWDGRDWVEPDRGFSRNVTDPLDQPFNDELPPTVMSNLWVFMVGLPLFTLLNEILTLLFPVVVCRLLPKVRPPLDVPLWSFRAIIATLKMKLVVAQSENLGDASIQALYLKLCGAKVGKGSSMSEQVMLPETVEIGKNVFFASGNTITSVEVDQGRFRVPYTTKIADSCFFGNENHIREGLPAETFVGIRTWVPTTPATSSSLFGNPAMKFGRAGSVGEEPEGSSFEKFWFHFSSSFIDVIVWKTLKGLESGLGFFLGRLAFPVYSKHNWGWQFVGECAIFAGVQLLMWYLVSIRLCRLIYNDRLGPEHRYYSRTVMAWFSANKIRKVFKPPIKAQGSMWMATFMRMYGVQVGKRFFSPNEDVMIDPPFGRLGDDITVDYDAQIRQHSFEDNLLKWGPNWIHNGTSILQAGIVAMSDCGEGVCLMHGAVTWKGQLLEPGMAYSGAPAQPVITSEELIEQELMMTQSNSSDDDLE
mmetsp:Transcript_16123/g.35384  ORF Transcript_16123/g.35384 Transcript_16123/m.35384 type:complete len:1962 (-) Transcript_16123:274-6159(-)